MSLTTDLALCATKQMAAAISYSMEAMVDMERYPWLLLSWIKEKEKSFFHDVPISPSGLFETAVETVEKERFREMRTKSTAFRKYSMINEYLETGP